VDLGAQKVVSRTILDHSFYGLVFAPDGKRLYASGGEKADLHQFDFEEGLLHAHKRIALAGNTEKTVIGGIAFDAAGKTIAAAGTWGDALYFADPANPEIRSELALGANSYPY